MQRSLRQLVGLAVVLLVTLGLVSGAVGGESGGAKIGTVTAMDRGWMLPETFIEVQSGSDGEVLSVMVRNDRLVETDSTGHALSAGQQYYRLCTASLPDRDWQRALDGHLGSIRMDFGTGRMRFDLKIVGYLNSARKSQVLSILKRRGFTDGEQELRSTGYLPPGGNKY